MATAAGYHWIRMRIGRSRPCIWAPSTIMLGVLLRPPALATAPKGASWHGTPSCFGRAHMIYHPSSARGNTATIPYMWSGARSGIVGWTRPPLIAGPGWSRNASSRPGSSTSASSKSFGNAKSWQPARASRQDSPMGLSNKSHGSPPDLPAHSSGS
jgi:hypothetical protein